MGRSVRWAGDPSKPTKVDRHGARLTPRGSFAEWLEVTRQQSAPWTEVELEAAEALRFVLLEHVLQNLAEQQRERELAQTRMMTVELEKRVAQRTLQLRALATDLEIVGERERRQIARDLHDDLGQILAASRIRLAGLCEHPSADVAAAALSVDELIFRANNSIRSLAAQLAPDVLHELGLSPALEWLGEEMERTFDIKVTLRDDGLPKPLAPAARSILYRAVRELLINVAKHSQADTASVDAVCDSGRLFVTVSDPGIGFDVEAEATLRPAQTRGLGLLSLRERLTYIGGNVQLKSAPGSGTIAVLTAPLLTGDAAHAEH
jgi:signal transduction histidine kinase